MWNNSIPAGNSHREEQNEAGLLKLLSKVDKSRFPSLWRTFLGLNEYLSGQRAKRTAAPGCFSKRVHDMARRIYMFGKLKKVWTAYQRMEGPTLIHCSAGIGRTREAVSYIKRRV